MSDSALHTPSAEASPPDTAYDTSRVSVRGTFWFIAGLGVSMALILLGVWKFQAIVAGAPGSPPFTAPVEEQPLQPSPNHPTTPAQDMAALRAAQVARLHASDPARHQMSIEQAMDQLLKSGAFTRPWKNPATQPYLRPPSEPAGHSVENRT